MRTTLRTFTVTAWLVGVMVVMGAVAGWTQAPDWPIIVPDGGAIRTRPYVGSSFLIQAYNTTTGVPATLLTATAGTTPTLDLVTGTTIGSAYLYRVGGTDVSVADGGTGASTLTGLVKGNGTSAFTTITTSSGMAGVISDETGTGLMVFDTAPSFATTIRVGAAATYDGIIISPAVKGANQFDLALSTIDLTAARAINFPNAAGTIALTADKLSAFAATSSAEFAGVISDETGSGVVVLGTEPVFTTSATVGLIASQDVITLSPLTSATRFTGTLIPADLTADRTFTFPNATGYFALACASDPRITAGSGTGVTVNEVAAARRVVYKVTVDSTQFVAADVTADVTLATLPAKTRVVGVYADLTTTFACTGTCTTATLSMTVGTSAGGTEVLDSFDADAATAVFGDADAELGSAVDAAARVQDAYLAWAGATISARLTSGTGNIGTGSATNLSQGTITFYLITEVLP